MKLTLILCFLVYQIVNFDYTDCFYKSILKKIIVNEIRKMFLENKSEDLSHKTSSHKSNKGVQSNKLRGRLAKENPII